MARQNPECALTVGPIIYLDHQAHSPIGQEALAALVDAYARLDFNPASSHGLGEIARLAVESARTQVASLVKGEPGEVIFLSGATEANNLVFSGMADFVRSQGRTRTLVSAGEHPSVLAAGSSDSVQLDLIELDRNGRVNLDHLASLLGPDVGIVSISAANHEIGTTQPLKKIAELVRSAGAILHSDLSQAAGKYPVSASDFDLASISSHKLGGPAGVGALYVKRRLRRRLAAMVRGGGQEGGARAGTIPVPLCVSFGVACEIAGAEMSERHARVSDLRDALLNTLSSVGGLTVNGGLVDRLAGNLNVSFDGVDGEALVLALRERVACSTGSACTSASLEPSPVLLAIGADDRRARGAVRFSLGATTTREEVDEAGRAIVSKVVSLRSMMRRVA
jgi:cysteine desulfurase